MDGHKQIKILARRKQEYEPEQVSSYENPISESPIESFFTPNCSKKQKMSIVSLIHSPEDMVSEKKARANSLPAVNREKLPGIAGLLNETGPMAQAPAGSTSTVLGYQPEVMRQHVHQESYVPLTMRANPPLFPAQKLQPHLIPMHHHQQLTFPTASGLPIRNYYPTLAPRRAASFNLPPSAMYNHQIQPKTSFQPQQRIESGQTSATLKYSHKMAERKRRKDMNDTFDELRNLLPFKHGNLSKWEILNGASEHIENLKKSRIKLMIERETLHRELGLPAAELVNHTEEIL